MNRSDLEYTVSDLSRALLRQYLSQKGLKNTLQAFEKEDTNNKKKINKNVLIEMISMKNLFLLNKNAMDSQNTMLQILISYLHKKYRVKKNQFTTTQPDAFKRNLIDPYDDKKQFQNPKNKHRINSNKDIKTVQQTKKNPVILQKEDLKGLYQKLEKVEEIKPVQTKLQKQAPAIDKKVENQKMAPSKQIKNNQKIVDQKVKIKEELIISKPLVIEMDQQYQEQFQEEEIVQSNIKSQKQIQQNPHFQAQLKVIHEQSLEQTHKSMHSKNVKPLSSNNLKQMKKQSTHTIPQTKIQQKNKNNNNQKDEKPKLIRIASQQNVNTLPVVNILQSIKQIQLNHNNNKKEQFKLNKQMGACVEKVENVKYNKKQQQTSQMAPKSRAQNMKVLKKPEGSVKQIQTIKPQQKKQQPKIQIRNIQILENKTEIKIVQKQALPPPSQIKKQVETPVVNAPVPVMVAIGKKKKIKQQTNEQNYPTKFKFDENFTHQIPKEIMYQYKPYNFQPITLNQKAQELYPWMILQSKINYKQKGGGVNPLKKKVQKIISSKQAQKLRQIVFKTASPILPKAWHQGFILSPFEQTSYGLKQIQGGPCGIIAALQCYYLKHLLFCSKQNSINDETVKQVSLVAAIANVLWKVKSSDKFILAFPPKNASKVDVNNLKVLNVDVPDFQAAFAAVWSVRDEYIGNNNHGVTSLLFTCVLTRGFQKIQQQIDNKQNPLIGNHGHCTQQFVNMLLTGKASSNCFDGEKLIDDYKIKGVTQKSQYGFLTIFETLKYIQVGKNLKNPVFPVWIICKQFHYHVIFAPHYLISEQNKSQKFDIVYFDGLYNCGDRIRLTLENIKVDEEDNVKIKDLPLIQQVMMTKWGRKNVNWNGSTKIL